MHSVAGLKRTESFAQEGAGEEEGARTHEVGNGRDPESRNGLGTGGPLEIETDRTREESRKRAPGKCFTIRLAGTLGHHDSTGTAWNRPGAPKAPRISFTPRRPGSAGGVSCAYVGTCGTEGDAPDARVGRDAHALIV